ncbi:MAG TPA: methyl-accepting chemotaxis protein [Syntrophomonadaceae bacterium]|nr:methyl-accepting chemotaxis protein [Syntrophomonadaceae bacterium]
MLSLLNWFENLSRRVNVRLRLIVIFTLVLAAITGVMGIYATSSMSDKVMEAADQKLVSDLTLGSEILDSYYPGDWQLKGGSLYKGDILIEGNYGAIDRIGELTGNTVTIFKHDTRVSTNVTQNGERMIDTKVSDEVAKIVLQDGQTYIGKAEVVGTMNQTAYEPIKDKTGEIIGIWYVGVPATPYEQMVNSFRINMILYSILGIFLGFIAAFLIAYTVHTPLRRVGEALNKASEGDLTQKIPILAHDEVGQLAIRANVMMENMAKLIAKNKELTDNIADSSGQLLKRSEISAGLMEDMAGRAEEMNYNTDLQADLTSKSREAIGQMTTVIQQVAENAQEVSASVVGANNMAQEGGQQIDKAIQQIAIINNTVNTTAEIIGDLGNKSQEIGQIVDLITNIANQTNLLALNAAIEAARAGEQGRGFAVVAEEVRHLAEESEEATQRIALLIKQVQEESDRAVLAMGSGTKEVANGTEVVAKAGEAFGHIISAVEEVNEQIQEMSAASQEMAASAETSLDSIEQMNTAADSNAKLAYAISESTEEQMAVSEEINASVDKMNNIVHDLEDSIKYFKI